MFRQGAREIWKQKKCV